MLKCCFLEGKLLLDREELEKHKKREHAGVKRTSVKRDIFPISVCNFFRRSQSTGENKK